MTEHGGDLQTDEGDPSAHPWASPDRPAPAARWWSTPAGHEPPPSAWRAWSTAGTTAAPEDPATRWRSDLERAAATRPPTRTAVLVIAGVVVLSMLAAGVAGLAARSRGDDAATTAPQPAGSTAAGPLAAAPVAALTAVMDRRSKAVLGHDRAAFLRDVDTRDRSFVAAQARLYDNLQRVPLRTWSYQVLPDGAFNRPDLAARYGGPAQPQGVVLRYAIAGFDTATVARGLIYTFVRRGSAWKLGGDSDLDGLLPPGGHAEPWDVQPIAVVHGKSCIVIGARADSARLAADARRVDTAIGKVAAMWKSGWSRKVVVITSSDQSVIKTYFRGEQAGDLSNTAAIHVPTFDNLFNWFGSGFPSQGPTGGRIIMNPRADIQPDDLPFVLTHEVTHAATESLQGASPPTWLVEGAAEYTAYRELELTGVDIPSGLEADLEDGIDYLPTNTGFYTGDVDTHYVTSWLACAYVADHWAEATLRRLYAVLGGNDDVTGVSDAEDAAFRSVLHTDRKAFLAGLTAYVKQVSS
jgi:hypothetical protein